MERFIIICKACKSKEAYVVTLSGRVTIICHDCDCEEIVDYS